MATRTSSRLMVDPTDLVTQRRRGGRQIVEAPATLFDESAPFLSPGYLVRVHDISLAGIGFRSEKQVPIGSTHRIHLVTRDIRVNSRVCVTRCKKGKGAGKNDFEVGCEFTED